jgi:hypothetical protein
LRLGTAPPARCGATRHLAGAVIAKVCDLRAPPRVGIGHPKDCSLRLVDLAPAVVANQNGFSGQFLLLDRLRYRV